MDVEDFVGFDGFDYLYDKQRDACGDGFEVVKNGLEFGNDFDVIVSFEDRDDFGGENVDEVDRFGCFSGEDDGFCDDGVHLSDVKHVPEVKNYFDSDDLEKKEESGDCGPARKDVKEEELYDVENKVDNENTMKDEGKEKKQNGWNCGQIFRVFVKGFLYFCNFNY